MPGLTLCWPDVRVMEVHFRNDFGSEAPGLWWGIGRFFVHVQRLPHSTTPRIRIVRS